MIGTYECQCERGYVNQDNKCVGKLWFLAGINYKAVVSLRDMSIVTVIVYEMQSLLNRQM